LAGLSEEETTRECARIHNITLHDLQYLLFTRYYCVIRPLKMRWRGKRQVNDMRNEIQNFSRKTEGKGPLGGLDIVKDEGVKMWAE
jgi:hypothetical protein